MINFTIKGAIFDVDDTLLDNKPGKPGSGLHEQSRLAAVHKVGEFHNIPELAQLSARDNLDAFLDAPVHTLEGAVWNILRMTGIADSETINPDHPLLTEIVKLKNELHEDILLSQGEEVPGAASFIRALAAYGLGDKLAIASTAIRRDIDIFLKKTGLEPFFPESRIISRESITHPKPHPEVFILAFGTLGIPKEDKKVVCAFEDDPRGVMAAKSAGLFACAISTRYSRESLESLTVPPDMVADSFEEFTRMLGISNLVTI